MTDNKNETGKGPPRPSEAGGAKRPYATIDLKATEVGSKDKPAGAETKSAAPQSGAPKAQAGDAVRSAASQPKTDAARPAGPGASKPTARWAAVLSWLAVCVRSSTVTTHAAAGAAGALLLLIASWLFMPGSAPELGALTKRVADMEGVVGVRSGSGGLRGKVDELSRSVGTLGDAQTKLASEAKALANRQAVPPDIGSRLARLEETLALLPTAPGGDMSDAAKDAVTRMEQELAAVKTDAGRLGQRVDGLRGEIDDRLKGTAKAADIAPLAAKMAALEQDLQSFLKSETERNANASRVVLSLELATLKRAMDRGEGYASELAAVKKSAGDQLNLAPLERTMHEGVPTVPDLAKSFRKVANAMIDAESEPADATLVDRLLSGARSIVRVRKAGHGADDTSAEAVVGRMDGALKDGRLGDLLKESKKLPPKAALAGEDWLRKVEARHAVDQALADIEATLKTSLGAQRGIGTDAKR